jgi:hypothetical protein
MTIVVFLSISFMWEAKPIVEGDVVHLYNS